jgi:hypothetical protein
MSKQGFMGNFHHLFAVFLILQQQTLLDQSQNQWPTFGW